MSCMIKGKMRSGLLMPIFLGSFALQAAAISGGCRNLETELGTG